MTDVVTGEPMNLQRIFLAHDGRGKAHVEQPKLFLKGHRQKHTVVRLWPDAGVTTGLGIAEGVETSLAAGRAFQPIWATLNAGNMADMPVLPGIESLTIIADNDPPNRRTGKRAGQEAAQACAKRWVMAGREVRVSLAEQEGTDFADFATGAIAI